MTSLVVEAPGPLALVEDLGRPGLAPLGVAGSGALDRGALALANRLVGNPAGAAGLEVLLGGRPVAPYTATRARDGDVLELGPAERGIRYLLAVRGGIDEPPVLGSRSRDTLAGIGPEPVGGGRVLAIGPEPAASVPLIDQGAAFPPPAGAVTLGLLPGPRADWFTDAARAHVFDVAWRCSASTDRVGARLDGPVLDRAVAGELPSEATVPGSIQVLGSGQPTILLADRPVTGGYPVIAIVAPASLDAVAQLRPGQEVRFRHA